jgi:hypothetical protein
MRAGRAVSEIFALAFGWCDASRLLPVQRESDATSADRPDADHLGQISALTLLEGTMSHNLTGLIETLDAG